MNRHAFWGLGVALVLALVAWFWVRRPLPPTAPVASVERVTPAPADTPPPLSPPSASGNGPSSLTGPPPALTPPSAPAVALPASAVPSSSVGASTPGTTPANSADQAVALIGLEKTRRMVHDYHTLMGENPVGTNAEIMQALMGGNSRQATLGPLEGQSLNARGELLDAWGTPYFFHQLSRDVMEIHSAGPDHLMGTTDDLVVR